MPIQNILGIFGGAPVFSEPLHVGRPNLGNREVMLRRVNEMFDRRWFTNAGPLVKEFEARIQELVGVKHCVAMCNATIALEIAIRALEMRGEVIVPAYTFIATAHALQWQEITPVFADMDPATHNLAPETIERLITPRTTGIIGVHVWGRPCDTEAIAAIAAKHKLKVMYDAAHAFGCSHQGKMIGSFGACEVFSFHATKFINCFEGGAVVTNDDVLADKLRLMRNFGFAGFDKVIYPGTNGKLTEVCAAMGLTSLEAMTEIISANRRNYEAYREGLKGLPGISLKKYDSAERRNYQYIVVEVDETKAPLNRDELVTVLQAENVLARKYFWPGCHRMEPYKSHFPNAHLLLPHTEKMAARIMVLPTGQAVEPDIIGTICRIIDTACAQAPAVRSRLKDRMTLSTDKVKSVDRLSAPVPIAGQSWPENTIPVVSICCITYNHKKFIAEALEGFLMQETTFPVEILINDDASTDGTPDILRSYQARYPKLIRVVYQTENQYSKGRAMLIRLLATAAGNFAALCEGDDFWICKHKLQKQVDFMEANTKVSICFHDAYSEVYDENNSMVEKKPFTYQTPPSSMLKFDDFARGFAPHTASCLILNRKNVFEWLIERKLRFAKTIFYALLEHGDVAAFLPEKMSVYRIHRGGVFSCISFENQLLMSNSGLWANRKCFSSRHHKMLFSLKLIENYIALLRIQLLDKRGFQSLSSTVRIMQLLFIPPSLPVIIVFSRRLFAYFGNHIGFKR